MWIYNEKKCVDFLSFIDSYSVNKFKSPFRSTIPMLILIKNHKNYLNDFINLKQDLPSTAFEYKVAVKYGKGKPSCTDLAIISKKVQFLSRQSELNQNT